MLPDSPQFIFYTERTIFKNEELQKDCLSFINKVSPNKCYFFTHNCDISRKSLYETLREKNVDCDFDNVMTPNYLLIKYCLNLYNNFKVYPISQSKDFEDFNLFNIKISYTNPDLIFINTNNINDHDFKIISKTNLPLVFSSNLCNNRFYSCNLCSKDCNIKYLKTFYRNRLIIPDTPPVYGTYYLFKYLSLVSDNAVVITDILRDDYIQYERIGCKVILLLTDNVTLEEYIKSPYDTDLVIDNFENLSYFLNLM